MKRTILFAIVVIFLFAVLLTSQAAAQVTRISIGATGTTSSQYAYFVAVGRAITKYAPEISPTVIETGGAVDDHERLLRKQIDMGLTSNFISYEHYNGLGKWEGKPFKDLRWLWTYSVAPLVIVVREDSGVKSIYDLNGKKFCAGSKGSGTEKLIEKSLAFLGIKPEYYRGGYEDAGMALENRHIVGLAKMSASEVVGDAMIINLSTSQKLAYLSFSKEDLAKIEKSFPWIISSKHPPGVYKGQDKEVWSVGLTASINTTTNMPPEIGYKIVKAVWQGMDIQEAAYPGVKGKHILKDGVATATVPLHVGVIKFCKENGIDIPKHLLPPEYK